MGWADFNTPHNNDVVVILGILEKLPSLWLGNLSKVGYLLLFSSFSNKLRLLGYQYQIGSRLAGGLAI